MWLKMGLELKSQTNMELQPNLWLGMGPEPKSQPMMGLELKS